MNKYFFGLLGLVFFGLACGMDVGSVPGIKRRSDQSDVPLRVVAADAKRFGTLTAYLKNMPNIIFTKAHASCSHKDCINRESHWHCTFPLCSHESHPGRSNSLVDHMKLKHSAEFDAAQALFGALPCQFCDKKVLPKMLKSHEVKCPRRPSFAAEEPSVISDGSGPVNGLLPIDHLIETVGDSDELVSGGDYFLENLSSEPLGSAVKHDGTLTGYLRKTYTSRYQGFMEAHTHCSYKGCINNESHWHCTFLSSSCSHAYSDKRSAAIIDHMRAFHPTEFGAAQDLFGALSCHFCHNKFLPKRLKSHEAQCPKRLLFAAEEPSVVYDSSLLHAPVAPGVHAQASYEDPIERDKACVRKLQALLKL